METILETEALGPRERRPDSEVELDAAVDGDGLTHIERSGGATCLVDLSAVTLPLSGSEDLRTGEIEEKRSARRDDGAEASSGDLDVGVSLLADACDLGPNVLPFPIAIRPYHQPGRPAGLTDEVLLDPPVIGVDELVDGKREEVERVARGPFAVLVREVGAGQMSQDRRDGELAILVSGQTVRKIVVADVLVRRRSLPQPHTSQDDDRRRG